MCRCMSIAFFLSHLALLSFIVSMTTTYWFVDSHDHGRQHVPTNITSCHKGLFEICCPPGDCEYGPEYVYNTTEVQTYYRVSQFLYGFSALNCAFAVTLFYISLMSSKCYNSVCVSGWISAEMALSAVEGIIALILLATNQDHDQGFPKEFHPMIGWSMYVAMGGVVVMMAALFANVLHSCKMHREARQALYERI